MSPQETILSRIKKLSALTEARGATPAEAAAAAAKVQSLLFEHNLTMASVDAHATAPPPEGFKKTMYTLKASNIGWQRTLLYVIARYNFCSAITHPQTTQMSLIGKPSNVEVVIYLYEHVYREIHSMGLAHRKLALSNKGMQYTSFCMGAVATIRQRLKDQQRTNETASTASTALVVQSQADLDKAVAVHFPRLVKSKATRPNRLDGFAAGQRAGHGISLNRGIGTSPSRRRLA